MTCPFLKVRFSTFSKTQIIILFFHYFSIFLALFIFHLQSGHGENFCLTRAYDKKKKALMWKSWLWSVVFMFFSLTINIYRNMHTSAPSHTYAIFFIYWYLHLTPQTMMFTSALLPYLYPDLPHVHTCTFHNDVQPCSQTLISTATQSHRCLYLTLPTLQWCTCYLHFYEDTNTWHFHLPHPALVSTHNDVHIGSLFLYWCKNLPLSHTTAYICPQDTDALPQRSPKFPSFWY